MKDPRDPAVNGMIGRAALLVVLVLLSAPAGAALLPEVSGVNQAKWGAWRLEIANMGIVPFFQTTTLAISEDGTLFSAHEERISPTEGSAARLSSRVNGIWSTETIMRGATTGGVAVDSLGRAHVAVRDYTETTFQTLLHAMKNGSSFTLTVVDEVPDGYYRDYKVVMDGTDAPHMVYVKRQPTGGVTYYAFRDGGSWYSEAVGIVSLEADIQVEPNGRVHIVHDDNSDARFIRYAVRDITGVWTKERVFGCQGFFTLALALDPAGNPHIVCRDLTDGLVYVHNDGVQWQREILNLQLPDGTPYPPLQRVDTADIAVDQDGRPHIAFNPLGNPFDRNTGPSHLVYATKIGGAWMFETIDPSGSDVGTGPAILLDDTGRPRITAFMVTHARPPLCVPEGPGCLDLNYWEPLSTPLGLVGE